MPAPTLVLIPGLLCDHAVWAPQIAALAPSVRCQVADHGLLSSLEAMASRVLEQAPPGPLAIAGHSMGGRVAFEVWRQAPERVERLALLDTGEAPRPRGAVGVAERAQRLALLKVARSRGMRVMGRQWARGMVHPKQLDTPLFEHILDMIERKNPEVFAAQIAALLARPDAGALLGRIRCPTLVLCGRQDTWSPPERHRHMAEAIDGAQLAVIEDSGHMSTMETPQPVTAALAEWLSAPALATRRH